MSEAAFWYEPRGSATPRRISLGRLLSDLQVTQVGATRTATTLSGRRATTLLRGSRVLRVESGPIDSYDVADELEEMAAYLRRGGLVSLAEDQSTAWASYATSVDASLLVLGGDPWEAYSVGVPTVGERFAIHGAAPAMRAEWHEVQSKIATPVSFYGGIVPVSDIRADWDSEPHILVRQYGFWPILRMPEQAMGASVLRHRHRRYWTLEITLETDEHAIAVLGGDPDVVFNGPTDVGNPTMVEHLRAIGGV